MFKKTFLASVYASLFATTGWAQTATESATSYTYHPDGQIHTIDGPRIDVADVTTYTYYADTGLTHVVTNALGHTTTYDTYNASGQPTQVTDNNGLVTTMTYHPRGWLETTTVTAPSGASRTTSYEYDAVGQITRMQLPTGAVLNYEYDDARRLTAIENGLGERIEYTLDAAGNRTREDIKDTNGVIVYSVARAFDELSRVMDVLGNDGQHEHIDYDADDNPIASTDAKNALNQQVYDNLNRLKTHIDPYNEETQFSYDSGDRIQTVTDARGNTTTYEYDALGHLLSVSSPDTGFTSYTYDAAGNRKTQTDSRGVTANYSYDALNRLTSVTYDGAPSENVTYTYDQGAGHIGKLVRINDATGSTEYSYNTFGEMLTKTATLNGHVFSHQYFYQDNGLLASQTYPSGTQVHYIYDAHGRLTDITTQADDASQAQSLASNISYAAMGPVSGWTYGNNLQQTLLYDLDYRLREIQVADAQSRFHQSYTFDETNNISGVTDTISPEKDQSFDYDLMGRLIAAQGVYGDLSYSYDAVGNRLSKTEESAGHTFLESYSYESLSNRLLSVDKSLAGVPQGSTQFTYDAAGNTVQKSAQETLQFSYSAANRPQTVESASQAIANYQHNALGQRVIADYGTHQELYIYDESGQLIAVSDQTGQPLREYIYFATQKLAVVKYTTSESNAILLTNTTPYGGQDISGTVSLSANDTSITLTGNRWRATQAQFEITPNTYLEFDFETDGAGEIHGIGLDSAISSPNSSRIFKLAGSQAWGLNGYNYTGGKQRFSIPVGSHYTGLMHLVIANDNDANPNSSFSTFSNIQICEGPCENGAPIEESPPDADQSVTVLVEPNIAYSGQDVSGTVNASSDQTSITLTGNRWRVTDTAYTITTNTVLEFDFSSDSLGEIQGIAVDEAPNSLNSSRVFKLTGSQAWGIRDFSYTGGTQHFSIPVGTYFTGQMHIGFVNDNDANASVSTSTFSNIRLCEGACTSSTGGGSSSSAGSATATREIYYVHNDHLGTPKMLTNQQQAVVWQADYTPFGLIAGGDQDFEKSRFPGQYYDAATGLYYNYFRDYDPEIGRYIQSDPIGLEGGINAYAYVLGNPVSLFDPNGLKPVYDKDGNILYDTCLFAGGVLSFLCEKEIPCPDDLPIPPTPPIPDNPLKCRGITYHGCLSCCQAKVSAIPSDCRIKCAMDHPDDPANPLKDL